MMKPNRNSVLRLRSVMLALMLGAMFALTAAAQTPPAPGQRNDNDVTRTELNNFDKFLDDHPNVARELRSNPNLINNPKWIAGHRELQTFLQQHPGVREEIKENPTQFMNRETHFERHGGDVSRAEAANADSFLDGHPQVAHELQQNPKLIDDPKYLAAHPGLNEFLQNHPEVKEDWKEHPNAFMAREKQYEKHEDKSKKR